MKLVKYLTPESVLLGVRATEKEALFELMCRNIASEKAARDAGLDQQMIMEAIIRREKQSSTGIGGGFAFPHARFPDMNSIGVCLALLEEPMDYASPDKLPVDVACMVIVPEQKPTMALKVMSQIARMFSNAEFATQIRSAVNGVDVVALIAGSGVNLDISIVAGDIMRTPRLVLNSDMALKEATRLMAVSGITAAPVVNGNTLVGEVSTMQLFQLGIPDFFTQLKSVSFISDFDPFEKYFFEEAHAKVSDLMNRDFCVMPSDATLMEIVFALTVKKYPKIYIVKNNLLQGIIDPPLVLERIINI